MLTDFVLYQIWLSPPATLSDVRLECIDSTARVFSDATRVFITDTTKENTLGDRGLLIEDYRPILKDSIAWAAEITGNPHWWKHYCSKSRVFASDLMRFYLCSNCGKPVMYADTDVLFGYTFADLDLDFSRRKIFLGMFGPGGIDHFLIYSDGINNLLKEFVQFVTKNRRQQTYFLSQIFDLFFRSKKRSFGKIPELYFSHIHDRTDGTGWKDFTSFYNDIGDFKNYFNKEKPE